MRKLAWAPAWNRWWHRRAIGFEIIVVNDASTDRTREIAQSFPHVRVVDAEPPPVRVDREEQRHGGGSKSGPRRVAAIHGCRHRPSCPAPWLARLRRPGQHDAALLSYSPEQEVHGFWEKAVMPVIFAELAATYRPSQVSDPRSPAAAANGQYILITREAYDAIGGHAAVSSSLLEDVALARVVKASGRRIFFRYGGDAVRTRMYRSFAQLREGWTKNLALLVSIAGTPCPAQADRVSADCRRARSSRYWPPCEATSSQP